MVLQLTGAQRLEIKEALPAHALKAANDCRKLGVKNRVSVRYKTADGKQFETVDKYLNMTHLIQHYKSYNKRDLLGYAEQMHFNSYKRWRRLKNPKYGQTPAELAQVGITRGELAKYKADARVFKPSTETRGKRTHSWAFALEYPDVRMFKANEVHREAPLSQMRRVIYDIEQAAEIYRNDPANRAVGWGMNVLASTEDEVTAQVAKYTVPERADAWISKAKRHCELYYEMLEEWVEENGRELNLRAVMWNLYYNKHQEPVNAYVHLVRDGDTLRAIMQFNHCHMKYIKERTGAGWAKLRYWTFCRFPNRLSKIMAYWQEAAVKTSCRPPNGRLFREQFMEWTDEVVISEEDQTLLEQGAVEGLNPMVEPEDDGLFQMPEEALKMEEGERAKELEAAAESGADSDEDPGHSRPRPPALEPLVHRYSDSESEDYEQGPVEEDDCPLVGAGARGEPPAAKRARKQ